MKRRLRTLGIIGGTGPETTVEYYRRLIAAYQALQPEGCAPSLVINSIDSKKLIDLVTASELTQMADYLAGEVKRLARAGAGLALIAANTPHLVFDEVQTIGYSDAQHRHRDARPAVTAGSRRLALFRHALHDASGVLLPKTQERLLAIVQAMKDRDDVDGLILGGTELSLILREPTAAGLPVLDTTPDSCRGRSRVAACGGMRPTVISRNLPTDGHIKGALIT